MKKGITPVVAIILLLLITVILFYVIYSWTQNYSSMYEVDVEQESLQIEVIDFKNDLLYLNSNRNAQLDRIFISKNNNRLCEFPEENVTVGKNNVSLTSCSLSSGEVYRIIVSTNFDTQSTYRVFK